ncbi:42044_t:CDS:1, partial [Gigaspora margarita]
MYFMVNGTNKKSSDCAIFNVNASVMAAVDWSPDPLGPDGMTMTFKVNQQLNRTSTIFTRIMFSFNDDKGHIIGYTLHPVERNATVIQDTFNVVIPRKIPSKHTISVALEAL